MRFLPLENPNSAKSHLYIFVHLDEFNDDLLENGVLQFSMLFLLFQNFSVFFRTFNCYLTNFLIVINLIYYWSATARFTIKDQSIQYVTSHHIMQDKRGVIHFSHKLSTMTMTLEVMFRTWSLLYIYTSSDNILTF